MRWRDAAYWEILLALAERHDFRIFADECYSELYRDTPPPGALETAARIGADPERVVIFHSLSKRSNMPGLRAGFAAGGPECIARLKQLRNYAGAPLPHPADGGRHARLGRRDPCRGKPRPLPREIRDRGCDPWRPCPVTPPRRRAFSLWLPVEDGEAAAVKLWQETGVRVLPGALSRPRGGWNDPPARIVSAWRWSRNNKKCAMG